VVACFEKASGNIALLAGFGFGFGFGFGRSWSILGLLTRNEREGAKEGWGLGMTLLNATVLCV
jgi:hypothetical protein